MPSTPPSAATLGWLTTLRRLQQLGDLPSPAPDSGPALDGIGAALDGLDLLDGTDPPGAAPAPDRASDLCAILGETTRQLQGNPHLDVAAGPRIADASALGGLQGRQLLTGLLHEGWAQSGDTAGAALEQHVDESSVELLTVTDLRGGRVYDWLRFTMGDTEVGYFYAKGQGALLGLVSDGEIRAV